MSAICGFYNCLVRQEKIEKMIEIMSFRGQQRGVYSDKNVNIGAIYFNAFKGIGEQPVKNNEEDIIAICDGEIYNYEYLTTILQKKGYRFQSKSDIDIIPYLYLEYGDTFFKYINGVFCIALYDKKNNKLLLGRDKMGGRSLFYSFKNGRVIFATTIKAILSTGLISTELDFQSIDFYFSSTCTFPPGTMFKLINNLRPGHVLIFCQKKIKELEYWSINDIQEDRKRNKESFKEELRETILDAIKLRTKGDKCFNAILSGGVDTSLIIAMLMNNRKEPLNVFSIGYDELEYDDSNLQDIMVKEYDLIQHKAIIKSDDIPSLISHVVLNLDYPLNNASAMGTYKCMNLAKGPTNVLFDGEAADEFFCGGGGVVGEKFVERFTFLPLWLRKLTFGQFSQSLVLTDPGKKAAIKRLFYRIAMPGHERMLSWLPSFDRHARHKLFSKDLQQYIGKQDEFQGGKYYLKPLKLHDGLNIYQYGASRTYLPNDLLFKNERMAAANGITLRTPFLDDRIVELAFKIPAKFKLPGFISKNIEKKLIYRESIDKLIPDEILWRKKTRGFSQPIALWIKSELKEFIADIIFSKQVKERNLYNINLLETLFNQHINGVADRSWPIWSIISLELWMREYVDKR